MAYRVAIVDDCETDAAFVKGILTDWVSIRQIGVQAEVFPSAERFLFRYAEDKDWDILLLDIEMGAMDGVTMAKKVRAHNEVMKAICTTSLWALIGKVNPFGCFISICSGILKVCSERSYTKNTSAVGYNLVTVKLGTCMEYIVAILVLEVFKTGNFKTLVVLFRITVGSQNYTNCCVICKIKFNLVKSSIHTCFKYFYDVILHSRKHHLGFRVTKTGIVL